LAKYAPKYKANYEQLTNYKEFPLFGRGLPLQSLALVCRSLSTLLGSGVGIRKALKLAGDKTGHPKCEKALRGVCEAVERGEDITTGMKEQGEAFPPLMIDMVHVAEQTGSLPEVLKGLAAHYDNLIRLRKNLIRQISWPIIQLVIAIFVIALLIFILGWIAESRGGVSLSILPGGLTGTFGAIIWLAFNFGMFFGLFVLYQWTRHSLVGQKFLDPFLLKVPVLGKCLRSFAIARFSWAFAITQQSGMSIQPSLESSFKATSNGAFTAAYPEVWRMLQAGETLGDSLAATKLFPEDYLQMVHSAEVSGTVPEMLDHLSPQFEEDARLSLQTLTTGLAWAVWVMVAGFIIFMIFRIFSFYLGALNTALQGI
jgi:type IV pilus assembly protein PilC